jgi:hypothetical protein
VSEPVTLLVGLDPPEVDEISERISGPVVASEMLPRVRLTDGELTVEDRAVWGRSAPVGRIVFHAIYEFEPDLRFLNTVALWGGPCLPNPIGMLLARPRVTNLAVARTASRFAQLRRTYLAKGGTYAVERPTVAKWGEWHCGEGKEVFDGERTFEEPTLLEPFVSGEAIRVQVIGDSAWQIRLGGDDWKKSIHHTTAGLVELNPRLVTDVRAIMAAFRLELGAADYIVEPGGTPHLLEFNHIPNVTQFPEIREAYLTFVTEWVSQSVASAPAPPRP